METVESVRGWGVVADVNASVSWDRPAVAAVDTGRVDPEFPRPGLVLEGKYRLVRCLAEGSMSSVWFAEHLVLAAPVAIKFMQPGDDPVADADVRRRFLREARIATAVRSPHVVQVLDYGVERDIPYIVMEFLRGESLASRLRRTGRLSAAQTAEILSALAPALRRAHELGVVHRDLKPENIFLVPDGEREATKLLDFGVAKVRARGFGVSMSRDTADGEIVGTPQYMSPEQARGARSVDLRTDVWALGVIAFECVLGHPPFIASGLASLLMAICALPLPIPSLRGDVPAGFDAWFARACARSPDLRFSSIDEAVRQLSIVCAERGTGRRGGWRSTPMLSTPAAWWRATTTRWASRFPTAPAASVALPATRPARPIAAQPRLPWRWLAIIAIVSLIGGAATGAARRRGSVPRDPAPANASSSALPRPDAADSALDGTPATQLRGARRKSDLASGGGP